jgi:subtilisin family serine protease
MSTRLVPALLACFVGVSCRDSETVVGTPSVPPAAHARALDLSTPHVPDELIFDLPASPPSDPAVACFEPRRTSFLSGIGADVVRAYKLIRACRVRFRTSQTPSELNLQALAIEARRDLFEHVDPVRIARLEQGQAPNDQFYLQQWGLDDIDAPLAWETTKGSPGVRVAVIDSGIDYLHPDLMGNIWANPCETVLGDGDTACLGSPSGNGFKDDVRGYNFAADLPDPMDTSALAHGTMVAGVIGAVTNNNMLGIAGTNWHVRLLALKFAPGSSGLVADAAEAIHYAVNEKVHVINASFSFEGDDPRLRAAVERAQTEGILVVAAAATDEGDPQNLDDFGGYPCVYELSNVLCVTAIDQNAELASSWGATTVDLGAPGVGIRSTFLRPDYRLHQGASTSLAAPFVTGVAALIHAACPGVSLSTLRSGLLTGKSFTAPMGKQTATSIRLNAKLALEASCSHLTPPGQPTLLP